MKTQPKFKLDRTFHGPFRVYEVTDTNVKVKTVTTPDAESRTLSLQQVSKCKGNFATNQSWLGHNITKSRKRRKSGIEIPGIHHVMPILTCSRQFIGHGMEEQYTHQSDF